MSTQDIVDQFNVAFADYVTDGVPASGAKRPNKAEVRAIGPTLKSVIDDLEDAIAGGLVPMLGACDCAAAGNVTLSGEQTLDGVTTDASRVLAWQQDASTENGVYVSGSGAWTRATDADSADELGLAQVSVTGGDTYSGWRFQCEQTAAQITSGGGVGSAALSFRAVASQDGLATQEALDEVSASLTAHTADAANPHGVTKAQVGLADADNTSDADKPVSTATQAAIDAVQADVDALGSVGIGSVAAAPDIDLSALAEQAAVLTGDAIIATFGTVDAGVVKWLRATGSPVLTHSESILLPAGRDLALHPGDVIGIRSEGANVWSLMSYAGAEGRAILSGDADWVSDLYRDAPLWHRDHAKSRYWFDGRPYPRANDFLIAARVWGSGEIDAGPQNQPLLYAADFSTGATAPWAASRGATLSVVAGALRVTNGGTNFGAAKLAVVTEVGAQYTVHARLAKVSGVGALMLVRNSNDPDTGTVLAQTPSAETSTTLVLKTLSFTATGALTYVTVGNGGSTVGHTIDVDDVRIFGPTAAKVARVVPRIIDQQSFAHIAPWRASRSASLSAVNGRLCVTNGAADYGAAVQTIATVVGQTYRVVAEVGATSGAGLSVVVRKNDDIDLGTVIKTLPACTGTYRRKIAGVFAATSATTNICLSNGDNTLGHYCEIVSVEVAPVRNTVPAGGRVHVRATLPGTTGAAQTIWQADDGSESNRVSIWYDYDGHVRCPVVSGGSAVANIDLGAATGATVTVDLAWAANGVFARLNGGFWEGDSDAAIPADARIVRKGTASDGTGTFIGTLHEDVYWPDYGYALEDVTYPSSIDGATYGALKARLFYPYDGDDLPVIVVMHGLDQSISSFSGMSPYFRWAAQGAFVLAVGMRGNDNTALKDCSGREIYDIVDAVEYVRAHYPQASKAVVGIAGYSGGGGNVYGCAARFPDYFVAYAAHFGFSDYGAAYDAGPYTEDIGSAVGGSTDAVPDNYRARKFSEAIPANLQGGHLWIFHDDQDTAVLIGQTTALTDGMDAAGNTRYTASITTTTDTLRWTHGLPDVNFSVRYTEKKWLQAMLHGAPWTFPVRGSARVHGWLRTKLFEVRLGNMMDATAMLAYDAAAGTYTVTPVAPATIAVTITTPDGKSARGNATGATMFTVS